MLKRVLGRLIKITVDKAYGWWLIRQRLNKEGVTLVIKHREFGWRGVVNNDLLDDTTYH